VKREAFAMQESLMPKLAQPHPGCRLGSQEPIVEHDGGSIFEYDHAAIEFRVPECPGWRKSKQPLQSCFQNSNQK
jgi:hypothetical protein